jgi:hypothetical protein
VAMKACDRCWPVYDGPGTWRCAPATGSHTLAMARTPVVIGGGAVGNHGGVAGGVATAVFTIVDVLAATTVVATIVVPMPVVVAAVTVVGAAAVVLDRRVRRNQRWRQWSG